MLQPTFHSNCVIFIFKEGQFSKVQCFGDLFAVCYRLFKNSGSFRFGRNETVFALLDGFRLLWGVSSASSWISCSRQRILWFYWSCCSGFTQIFAKLEFLFPTALRACWVSSSFSWHHGFGHWSSSFWSHAGSASDVGAVFDTFEVSPSIHQSGFQYFRFCVRSEHLLYLVRCLQPRCSHRWVGPVIDFVHYNVFVAEYLLSGRASQTAAWSSNYGIFICLMGATWHFPIT